jgi:hypothetical protein
MHFSHVPPTQYCKYTMTTPTPVQRTLFTLWENESQENELRVLLLPGCPSIVTTLRWSRGKSGWAKGNPSCGFVDPWWAIVRTAESSTARESRLLVHFSKAPINLLNGFCLRRRVSGRWLEASSKYTHESPVSAKFISVHRHFTVSRFRTWASIPS